MKKVFLLCFILSTFQILGQIDQQYRNLVNLGDKLSYNFKFDSTKTVLDSAISIKPNRPEAYLAKAKIYLWYFLGSKDQIDYQLFLDYSDSVISKTELLLSENNNQPDIIYLAGNIYKYRAMAFGSNNNTMDAFWSTKKAVSYYEDVIDLDSNFYDAYGGIGIFEYALSYVPAIFNWALALSGLTADQKNGFNYIQLSAEKARIDKEEYTFHLSKLYDEYLAEYEISLSLIKKLIKEFPLNQLFHYQAAIQYIKLKRVDIALHELNIVQSIDHPKFSQTNSFSNFLLGDIHFRKNQFQKAIEYYELFLTTTITVDYTGIASFRKAICHYFLGNEMEFRKSALLACNGNLDLEEDNLARELGLEILESGFSKSMQILYKIENSFLSGESDSLLKYIEANIDSVFDNNIIAQILVYQSSILIDDENIDAARESLENIDSMEIETMSWVQPMKYFNLAKISYLENNYIMAIKYLDLAERSNDYERKKEIQSYINGLRKKIVSSYKLTKSVFQN